MTPRIIITALICATICFVAHECAGPATGFVQQMSRECIVGVDYKELKGGKK